MLARYKSTSCRETRTVHHPIGKYVLGFLRGIRKGVEIYWCFPKQAEYIEWETVITERRRSINPCNSSFSLMQRSHRLSERTSDRMRDDAAECRRARSRFSHVNTCNLTDTDTDTSAVVPRGQRMLSTSLPPLPPFPKQRHSWILTTISQEYFETVRDKFEGNPLLSKYSITKHQW